jgi:thioredoxin 1
MTKNNGVEEISEHEFESVINKPLALVDFFAEWCMPCLMMAPAIEELAVKIKQVKFAKLNVDENQGLSQKFKVMSIPCLIVFKQGKEVERIIGNQPAEVIEEKLKKWMK